MGSLWLILGRLVNKEATTMKKSDGQDIILGLDIGVQSIGWALLSRDKHDFSGIIATGARIFDPGVDGTQQDIQSGRDKAKGVDRRLNRQHRRLLKRRVERLRALAHLLQANDFLPSGEIDTPEQRDLFFKKLDSSLFAREDRILYSQVLPYRLRAQALDSKLTPHELGRAIYHLAHRRGYRPVSQKTARENPEQNKVETGIHSLNGKIRESGARTIGEYFFRINPAEERIRGRWTARDMFQQEFDAIWESQTRWHTYLTPALYKELHRAIFYQRPISWDRTTIGRCDLEKTKTRAPLCLLDAQRFRLLQRVNDLTIIGFAHDDITLVERRLCDHERAAALVYLENEGDLTFKKLKNKILKLPKTARFNLEDTGEDKLFGNRTRKEMLKVFGERWNTLASAQQDEAVEDARITVKRSRLEKLAREKWQLLDDGNIELFCTLRDRLEDGHCALSKTALKRLLPHMECGTPYATARKLEYGNTPPPAIADELPPVRQAPFPELRNPIVSRALTELRHIVNAIIHEYGKPEEIRIELGRDLKRSRKDRAKAFKRNLDQRRKREDARLALEQQFARKVTENEVDKYLLWKECDEICPYTGAPIPFSQLFCETPQFDIEHIIPFSRSLDDSFLNKTLCCLDENRNPLRKGNRTPFEAYGGNRARWADILQHVKNFKGDAAEEKLRRFQLEHLEDFEDFTSRQLNDMRYASRLAIQYLGLLYGTGAGGVDGEGTRRIQAGRGEVTKYLRDEYGLNRVLGDGGTKNRNDHRHHAIDAIAIALSDPIRIRTLSDAADHRHVDRRRRFARLPPPWPSFLGDVMQSVSKVHVSCRQNRGVNQAMHDATLYALRKDNNGRLSTHIRKVLNNKWTEKQMAEICDRVVKEAVLAHWQHNARDSKKAFGDLINNPPRMPSGTPIRRVRVKIKDTVVPLAKGVKKRFVITGSNHHMELVEKVDNGKSCWNGHVVSTLEAMSRLRLKQPLIKREWPEGQRFVCTLTGGELFLLNTEIGGQNLFRVRSVSNGKVEYVNLNDARLKEEIKSTHEWMTSSPNELRKKGFQKCIVTPLGQIRKAND